MNPDWAAASAAVAGFPAAAACVGFAATGWGAGTTVGCGIYCAAF
jgi:hypothetical protein